MAEKRRPCSTCGKNRAEDDFYQRKGKAPFKVCKECSTLATMERYWADPKGWNQRTRERERVRNYGVTPERYAEMLIEQGGVCAICGQADKDRALAVDHDHTTGVVRALLCKGCNWAIGHLEDDPVRALRAAEYLRSHLGRTA